MEKNIIKVPSIMNSDFVKVIKWHFTDNDSVSKGQLLVELESGDFTLEIEAETDGILKIIAKEESFVNVNDTLCKIE